MTEQHRKEYNHMSTICDATDAMLNALDEYRASKGDKRLLFKVRSLEQQVRKLMKNPIAKTTEPEQKKLFAA